MSTFRIEDHPVVFLKPRLSYPYAWVGHVPFAYLLVDLLRPRMLVELGTDSGNSYLAFCQAVRELGVDTRCTAIDSWQGDPHARRYGEGVYETLKSYHDPRYGAFSRLHRSFFIDALDEFEDGSIDLLHIDGLHTYEAVSEDFNTWLPKLSDRAVVIFHDSQVRERGFGVAKFLDELRDRYRIAEFEHSNGLGIALVGRQTPQAFLDFMDAFDERPAQIREFFKRLGDSLVDSDGHLGGARAEQVTPDVTFRVYYRGENEPFDDSRAVMAEFTDPRGAAAIELVFPDGLRPAYLRFDPADHAGVFGIGAVRLGAGGTWSDLGELRPRVRHVVGDLLNGRAGGGLTLVSFNEDPNVELSVSDVVLELPKQGALELALTVDYSVVVNTPSLWPLVRAQDIALQNVKQALSAQVMATQAEAHAAVAAAEAGCTSAAEGAALADIMTVAGAAGVAGILLLPGRGPKLYFRGSDEAFDESRSVRGEVIGLADAAEVRFDVSGREGIQGIRLDIPSLAGTYRLFGLMIDGVAVPDLRRRLTAVHGQLLDVGGDDKVIIALSGAAPFIELDVHGLTILHDVRIRAVRDLRMPWMEGFIANLAETIEQRLGRRAETMEERLNRRIEDVAHLITAADSARSAADEVRFSGYMSRLEDLAGRVTKATDEVRHDVAELARFERERGLRAHIRRVWSRRRS